MLPSRPHPQRGDLSPGMGFSSSTAEVIPGGPDCAPCLFDPFQSVPRIGCYSDLSLNVNLMSCSYTSVLPGGPWGKVRAHRLLCMRHPVWSGLTHLASSALLPHQPHKYLQGTHNSSARQALPGTLALLLPEVSYIPWPPHPDKFVPTISYPARMSLPMGSFCGSHKAPAIFFCDGHSTLYMPYSCTYSIRTLDFISLSHE